MERIKKHEKLTFVLFGIVILYVFCNTFYVVKLSLKASLKNCTPSYQRNFAIISRFFHIINACSNVVVYWIADRKFRRYITFYLKRMFYLLFCKLIPALEPTAVDENGTTSSKNDQKMTQSQAVGDRIPVRTPVTTRRGIQS